MKGEFITKSKPKSSDGIVLSLKAGVAIDKRTRVGKAIRSVKQAVREDLSATAEALLISDIANATVIAQAAFDLAMTERENLITDDGKVSQALATYAKWSAVKRSGLLALRQFRRRKAGAKTEPTLADVIIETTEP